MTIRGNRRALTWLAPLAVAGAVAGGTVLATAGPSTAAPSLRPLTARQLIADVLAHAAHPAALSGTVHQSAALGLPSLPGDASSASLSWQQLITGSHDARVWVDGPERQRIAVLGQLSEANVVHNGTDLWTYTSASNTATHTVLPAARAHADTPSATQFTPAGAATYALKAITPSTRVSVGTAQRVAGRPAYSLVLQPRDGRSTVRQVVLSVDAATFTPLRAQIFGAGSKPAFEVGFSTVHFARPAASIFSFRVPAGARVEKSIAGSDHGYQGDVPAGAPGGTTVVGSGWTSVLEIPDAGAQLGELANRATTAIPGSANRLLQTALVNAVLRPDGTVFVGAVRPALVEHLAASTR
jgi:outer membrane lipoprotein-sorting protein